MGTDNSLRKRLSFIQTVTLASILFTLPLSTMAEQSLPGDALIGIKVLDHTNQAITIAVRYTCNPKHGNTVYLGGWLLHQNKFIQTGYIPVAVPISSTKGNALSEMAAPLTIRTVDNNTQLADGVEVFLYEPSQTGFIQRRFTLPRLYAFNPPPPPAKQCDLLFSSVRIYGKPEGKYFSNIGITVVANVKNVGVAQCGRVEVVGGFRNLGQGNAYPLSFSGNADHMLPGNEISLQAKPIFLDPGNCELSLEIGPVDFTEPNKSNNGFSQVITVYSQ